MPLSDEDLQGWILACASGVACIVGASVIFSDILIRRLPGRHDFDIKTDKKFLVGSLSLGSGVLLYSAFFKMMPEAKGWLESGMSKKAAGWMLQGSFIAGVFVCMVLNAIVHALTPHSIIHCGDHDVHEDSAGGALSETGDTLAPLPSHHHNHSQDDYFAHNHNHHHDSERRPLLNRASTRSIGSMRCAEESDPIRPSLCAGYSNPCFTRLHNGTCDCRRQASSPDRKALHPKTRRRQYSSDLEDMVHSDAEHSHHHEESHGHEHHHHVPEPHKAMMAIGIQTAIAISLHKLPEGIVTFVTSHADRKLGFAVFLALAIHNLAEGFTIAFPLYIALNSRLKAFGAAILLGACSQPLGALIGYLWTSSYEPSPAQDVVYGVLFSSTAGFMSVIAIHSMLPQAIRNDQSSMSTSVFFFMGVALIGGSYAIAGS
ncbi:hypothetical protein G7K_4973-t1 [Saitoella complicata NRRL Y-17804]|uniref:Zinc/iron permease n=1 Tax=Saitoella complicata (strain BCRC 22490 / CBS 7301 / JCM 7358 / NBRC 10748 / NRRL Y-17804) TaxID=698492 RepID=A0A0E9NLX2_SAICN|nr:hypothetical protein G7K_4973-t1 [Saitoella complicata NRRL Y-17804]